VAKRHPGLVAGDLERFRTWTLEVAKVLLSADVTWRAEGDEHRPGGSKTGLSINGRNGLWYAHADGRGGWEPVSLVEYLKKCDRAEATAWAAAWLREHAGTGSIGGTDDDAWEIEKVEIARRVIDQLVPAEGTPVETYLRSRGIAGPIPSFVKHLPDARLGESGVAALLTADGRVVGAQVGYIDLAGRKSLVVPTRRRFMVEKAPAAVFKLLGDPPVADPAAPMLIGEGLEDMLSLLEMGWPGRVIGLPGGGTLKHVPAQPGEKIIVVRDGDEPGSSADAALTAGVDALLLQGTEVNVTQTARGQDANALLQTGGVEALRQLIATADTPWELSPEGKIERLSRLDKHDLDYAKKRKSLAKELETQVGTIDHKVDEHRRARESVVAPATDGDEIELLTEPVDLGETLDGILTEIKRYIVCQEAALAAVAAWCAHAHICHHSAFSIPRSVRLAIQGRTPGCGKTTLLEIVAALVPRARFSSALTAATVKRIMDAVHPTLLIDEVDGVLRDPKSELLQIWNAGDKRSTAWVDLMLPTPGGGWVNQRINVFGPTAFAGLDELPPTQQDRSIAIQMRRALFSEIPEHLRDGTSPALLLALRRLATWAAYLTEEPPEPALPDILQRQAGRVGDKWRILIAIADLAGGRWPALLRTAALEAVNAEARPSEIARLLDSVRRIFAARAKQAGLREEDRLRIPTPALIQLLLADSEEEWETANRGRAVTAWWLRDNLRHMLDPPGTNQWEDPAVAGQRGKQHRGYYLAQFAQSLERYQPTFSVHLVKPSAGSAVATEAADIVETSPQASAGSPQASAGSPQASAGEPADPLGSNPANSTSSAAPADPADGLDGGSSEGMPKPEEQDAAPATSQPSLSQLDRDIIAYSARAPNASTSAISKNFGVPPARVAAVLGRT
jgi:hypothetical protein